MLIKLSTCRFGTYQIFIARARLFPGSSLVCLYTFEEWFESSVLGQLKNIVRLGGKSVRFTGEIAYLPFYAYK